MKVKKIDSIDYEKLKKAEEELENSLASTEENLVIAKTLEATKGFSQGFVVGVVAELTQQNIPARFQISSGTLGIDSAGPIFHILVPVEFLDSAKPIIEELIEK